MPPMFPIWRSTTTRSGRSSSTAAITSGPERTSRMVTSGRLSVPATSARTDGASLATRIDGIRSRLVPGRGGSGWPHGGRGGARPSEEEVADGLEAVHVVDICRQEGHLVDGCRGNLGHQLRVGLLLAVG